MEYVSLCPVKMGIDSAKGKLDLGEINQDQYQIKTKKQIVNHV